MSQPIVYVDRSTVREGALPRLREAIEELAAFIQANEPRLISYSVYFSEDETEMSVVHVHPDEESLDYHLRVAGPRFAPFADLVELSSIRLYGRPTDEALEGLREKMRLLGAGDVAVYPPHAGFLRAAVAGEPSV